MATAAAVIGIGSSLASVNESRKANKANQKAARAQRRRAEIQNARSRRQTLANARRLQAQTIAQGVNQGISGGSSVQGAAGSVITQAASGIGFSQQLSSLDRTSFENQLSAQRSLSRGQTFGAFGDLIRSFTEDK